MECKNIIKNWSFPYLETKEANEKISENMEKLKDELNSEEYLSPYMKDFEGIKIEEAQSIFDSIISNRKSLEDKAKVNVLIVTVAVSVILGLSNFLFTLQGNFTDHYAIKIPVAILFILSLINLISGSISALATLNAGETKEIYNMSPQDYKYFASLPNEEKRNKEMIYFYSRYSELNNIVNWKINNYISCSFKNIRNAIFYLGIIGIIFCIVFLVENDNTNNQLEQHLDAQLELLETIDQKLSILQNQSLTNKEDINFLIKKNSHLNDEISDLNEIIKAINN
ncbi:hypothetical protein [Exiguobacterium sp. s131]|uniref:hypothetical protein n=1 Tax=Exiguobacterium sp. s131 TaxID=2751278 RepID=UPI001BEB1913|nr:hypothetical protein [Exiguobacterium sp. s131]